MIGPSVAMPWMRLAPFVGLRLTPWLFQSGFVGSSSGFVGPSKWFHGADTARRHFSFLLVRAGSLQLPARESGQSAHVEPKRTRTIGPVLSRGNISQRPYSSPLVVVQGPS